MPTLRIHSTLATDNGRPPLILIHGAANSASVWRFWQEALVARGWSSHALDLRGHGRSDPMSLADTGMADYAADVVAVVRMLRGTPILMGWSMGGLVAMMAAASCASAACVGLAPSIPVRVPDGSVEIRSGVFGPEEYGIVHRDPDRQPMMPDLDDEERRVALASLTLESRRARDERRAGVVIESLARPLLVITGTADSQWPRRRYEDLHLTRTHIEAAGASHWGLVLNRRVLAELVPAVIDWISQAAAKDRG